MPRLILWDIDGTLVHAGDVAARVFDEAIERVLGVRPHKRVAMSGKTDPQIASEYLDLLGIDDRAGLLPAILDALAELLDAAAAEVASTGRVLPGVEELLDRLGAITTVRQTVLTGNIAPNARVKLAAFGLDQRLDLAVGAYGSDHHDRRALVPIAFGRMLELRGEQVEAEDAWIIGDAANDLACARAGGVRCLLVATGRTALEELAQLKPDALVNDLADTSELVELLTA